MYLAAKVKIIEFESKPVEAVILSQVVSLKDDRTDVGSIISLNWAVVHGQKTGQAIILNWALCQVCFVLLSFMYRHTHVVEMFNSMTDIDIALHG